MSPGGACERRVQQAAQRQQTVVESPEAERGGVRQAVAVPRGGERPQGGQAGAAAPPVEAAACVQRDQGGRLQQVFL